MVASGRHSDSTCWFWSINTILTHWRPGVVRSCSCARVRRDFRLAAAAGFICSPTQRSRQVFGRPLLNPERRGETQGLSGRLLELTELFVCSVNLPCCAGGAGWWRPRKRWRFTSASGAAREDGWLLGGTVIRKFPVKVELIFSHFSV